MATRRIWLRYANGFEKLYSCGSVDTPIGCLPVLLDAPKSDIPKMAPKRGEDFVLSERDLLRRFELKGRDTKKAQDAIIKEKKGDAWFLCSERETEDVIYEEVE